MPKKSNKNSNNGFNLFRLYIKNQLRLNGGQRKTDEELITHCGNEWTKLNDDEKNGWKEKAKEEKRKSRLLQAANLNDSSASGGAGTSATSHSYIRPADQPISSSVVSVNTLNAKSPIVNSRQSEEMELLRNPEKRRIRDRRKFEDLFVWKYGENKEMLKAQKFYFLSSSVLHFTTGGDCIPAEVACVEFTCDQGALTTYCMPVRIPEDSCLADFQERIKELSRKSHQFTIDDLKACGRPPNEIAEAIISMSHKREVGCQNTRFFILNSEISTTFNCLRYLLQNSNLADKYKEMTVNDVGTVDDLAYALFKFYNVKYPKLASDQELVDFTYFQELIDGYHFNRAACQSHINYDGAYCCGSNLHLIAEIISNSVKYGKFDENYLFEYAAMVDPIRQHYYTGRNELKPSVFDSGPETEDDELDEEDDERKEDMEDVSVYGNIGDEDEDDDEYVDDDDDKIKRPMQVTSGTAISTTVVSEWTKSKVCNFPIDGTSSPVIADTAFVQFSSSPAASKTYVYRKQQAVSSIPATSNPLTTTEQFLPSNSDKYRGKPIASLTPHTEPRNIYRLSNAVDSVCPSGNPVTKHSTTTTNHVSISCLKTPPDNETKFSVTSEEKILQPPPALSSTLKWDSRSVRPPDTLPVQRMLPSDRRGFGRGLWLLPEAAFLDRLKALKMYTQ